MESLKNETLELLQIANKAIKWTHISEDGSGLRKPINSIRRNLALIEDSLRKRPSIAIFGQSQVGKSYLVQNLAKPFDEKFLKIKFSNQESDTLNFLTDMNPSGGKESTGLVTRFTTKNISEDRDFPFEVELFSQLDVAAILTNAFCSDLKDFPENIFEFTKEELKDIWDKLDTLEPQKGATQDESYYFKNYIKTHFKDFALIRNLEKTDYFTNIENRLFQIKPENRWEILEYLWGKNIFFTHLFRQLTMGIQRLNYNRNIRVNKEALTPNTKTILDVERVREIFQDETDEINIKLTEDNDKVISVKRAIISILTREVQLQLAHNFSKNQPQSFLNTSDLLDFPGSKSREKIPLKVFDNNTQDQKLQLLIRGKVSYLFDSYTARHGVSTLLYCMDNNPPEEKDAPSRLYNWIKKYVGKNQEDRSNTLNKTKDLLQNEIHEIDVVSPLLIAFTKMNVEIDKVLPGQETNIEAHDSKWQARFNENFINFMSRPVDDKWINNWTNENNNFNFIFPIRDPLYSQATFAGFDEKGSETYIRPEREEAMKAMKTSFTELSTVNNHTLNKEEIWSELSSPNGSGILFLSKHLKNSAHPIVTRTRIKIDLEKAKKELINILEPYRVSGNLNEDLKAAKTKGMLSSLVFTALANKTEQGLGSILNEFVLNDTEIWNLLYDYIFGKGIIERNEGETNNVDIIQSLKEFGIDLNPGMTKESILFLLQKSFVGMNLDDINSILLDNFNVTLDVLPGLLTENQNQTQDQIPSLIINFWTEKTMNKALNDSILNKLSEKQKEIFISTFSEIIKSKERLDLHGILAEKIRNIKSGSIDKEDLDLVASCSATTLNKFLFSAGWSFDKEENKPQFNNVTIFSSQGKNYSIEGINYEDSNTKDYFLQWNQGLKEIFEANVRFNYNLSDKNQNDASYQILNNIINDLQSLN